MLGAEAVAAVAVVLLKNLCISSHDTVVDCAREAGSVACTAGESLGVSVFAVAHLCRLLRGAPEVEGESMLLVELVVAAAEGRPLVEVPFFGAILKRV